MKKSSSHKYDIIKILSEIFLNRFIFSSNQDSPKVCNTIYTGWSSRRTIIIRTQNSELRILFNIIHEDCNKLVIVTIIKITVIKGKKI